MVRFRKGSKVEVFNKKKLPCCSWRVGEIVSGNGHTYDVKFHSDSKAASERVSRKSIRPFPPRVHHYRDWVPRDIVEVFDNMSWNAAVVSKLNGGGDYCLVRLLGSFQQIRAHKSLLRVRQIWIRNEWVMLGVGASFSDQRRSYPKSICKVTGTGGKSKLHRQEEEPAVAEHVGCFDATSLQPSDTESSVASCSMDRNSYSLPCTNSLTSLSSGGSDDHSSDAESFCDLRYQKKCSLQEEQDVAMEYIS